MTVTLLVDDVWSHPSAKKLLSYVSKTNARGAFARAGFTGRGLDIALGVSWAESNGYSDAVGDIALVDAKWGPSIGLFQVRSLRNPLAYSEEDRYRYAWALRESDYNIVAAFVLSKGGTDWTKWSTFNSGAYKEFEGNDYTMRTGHPRAGDWNK